MSEIKPALTAEQWATWRSDGAVPMNPADPGGAAVLFVDGDGLAVMNEIGESEFAPAAPLIALANASLPDDDPRKITREHVAHLRDAAHEWEAPAGYYYSDGLRLRALADILDSYLPPEP